MQINFGAVIMMELTFNTGGIYDLFKPEVISMIISALVALLTFTTFFQNRVANAEKRLTIIEEENKQKNIALKE